MQRSDHNDERDAEALRAPAKLISALSRFPRQRIFVPRTIDDAVLREARRHLNKAERPGFSWRRLMPRLAAVAVVVLLLAFVFARHNSGFGSRVFAREDLNHDGRVDILDAFALARQLKLGPASGVGQDINGDGVVDERDVETIAAQAVRLGKGGPS
jgi:hypothetical protein